MTRSTTLLLLLLAAGCGEHKPLGQFPSELIPPETDKVERPIDLSKFRSFTPNPESAEEWRENQFLIHGKYCRNWHGFPAIDVEHSFTCSDLSFDYNDPPRRLIAIRTEQPAITVGGQPAFEIWLRSWVDIDTDETIYAVRTVDVIVDTISRPVERKVDRSFPAISFDDGYVPRNSTMANNSMSMTKETHE